MEGYSVLSSFVNFWILKGDFRNDNPNGEDVGKREHLCSLGGNVNGCSQQCEDTFKI